MSAVETDPGWYERMAERAAVRRMVREAEDYANPAPEPKCGCDGSGGNVLLLRPDCDGTHHPDEPDPAR